MNDPNLDALPKDEAFGIVPLYRQPEGDRFLLIQHWAGHWGFPKGHAEPGETAVEAACREFEEETGIQDYVLLGSTSFSESYVFIRSQQRFRKTVVYFLAEARSKTVITQAEEIKAYAWLPYELAIGKITFEQAQQVLTRVHQHLQSLDPLV